MVTVQVVSAKGKQLKLVKSLPASLDFSQNSAKEIKVRDVKTKLADLYPRFYVSRQKLSGEPDGKALDDAASLEQLGIADGATLYVKDLGPQISWKMVFLVEYGGPLLIHPLFFHFPKLFYGKQVVHSDLQKFTYAMVMLHFFKRELETIFIHRFSHGTMPLRNLFRNSAHYHLLSGFALAYAVYAPRHSLPSVRGTIRDDPTFLWSCAALWLFAQLSNLHAHLTLKSLRPAGTTVRAIPRGYMFNLVSCANYFFEILSWTAISVMTNSIAAHVFLAFSAVTMTQWALKKHAQYKKEFGKGYPRRKAIIPFVI